MPQLSLNPDDRQAPAKPAWDAKSYQLESKKEDERDIQQMVQYKTAPQAQWESNIRKWNLLAEPINDPTVSNVLFPLARMLCTAGLTAMNKGRPGFGFRPGGPSDFAKIDLLWKPAIDGVLDECNYDNQQEFFLTDWEISGTGIYEVYNQSPTRTERIPNPQSETGFDETVKRDWTRPVLGVRYRTPFECGISPFARTAEEAPSCYYHEAMSWEQFVQNYARVKLEDGNYKYMNTEHVFPGRICSFSSDGNLEFRESDHRGVIVVCYQNKIKDVYRLWANGVLIFDQPLKKDRKLKKNGANVLGETTLCWGMNWHQHDPNRRTHSLYGMGSPHLIGGLDAIYQAFSNMTVDNWVRANSYTLSFKSFSGVPGDNVDLSNKALYSGLKLLNGGELISSPVGQVSLSNYSWFREFLEESAIWLGRNNFKQLVGDTSATAYELFQKVQANNEGFEYRLKKLENGCFKKMGRLLLGGVMSELPVADYEELTEMELEDVMSLIKEKKASADDYEDLLSEDPKKKPKRKRYYQIRTKGKVFKETPNAEGKYDVESLQEDDRYRGKQDGFVTARPEYLWSEGYMERGAVPDAYSEAKSMLGDNQNVKMAKVKLLAEYARVRVAEGMQVPELATRFNMDEIDDMLVEAVDLPKDRVFKQTDPTAETENEVDDILSKISEFLKPMSLPTTPDGIAQTQSGTVSAPAAQPFQPAPSPDLEGFTPFGRTANSPPASVGLAAGGAGKNL